MSSTALSTPLLDEEGSQTERTAGDMLQTPLLDEESLFTGKKRGTLKRYGYWIVYFGSVIAMSGLFAGIQQSLQNNRCECWDRFNYYCERAFRLLLELNELKRADIYASRALFISSRQRCSCSLPLYPSTIQRLVMVSKPLQGATNPGRR